MNVADLSGQPGDFTLLLLRVRNGDAEARGLLFETIYAELRRLAAGYMRREAGEHTLQPTALVHEAFLKLLGDERRIENRSHFFAVASQAMRRILVDYARTKSAKKRGGGVQQLELHEDIAAQMDQPEKIIALDRALSDLEAFDVRKCRVVELRFFGGLEETEIAEALNISARTVKRDWALAKAWLHARMR